MCSCSSGHPEPWAYWQPCTSDVARSRCKGLRHNVAQVANAELKHHGAFKNCSVKAAQCAHVMLACTLQLQLRNRKECLHTMYNSGSPGQVSVWQTPMGLSLLASELADAKEITIKVVQEDCWVRILCYTHQDLAQDSGRRCLGTLSAPMPHAYCSPAIAWDDSRSAQHPCVKKALPC